jgi:hypothetical protein
MAVLSSGTPCHTHDGDYVAPDIIQRVLKLYNEKEKKSNGFRKTKVKHEKQNR